MSSDSDSGSEYQQQQPLSFFKTSASSYPSIVPTTHNINNTTTQSQYIQPILHHAHHMHSAGTTTLLQDWTIPSPAGPGPGAVGGKQHDSGSDWEDSRAGPIRSTGSKTKKNSKRKRRHASCEPCRRRKVKCDRSSFCANCKLHNTRCFWLDAEPTTISEEDELMAAREEINRLRLLVQMLSKTSPVLAAMNATPFPTPSMGDPFGLLSAQHHHHQQQQRMLLNPLGQPTSSVPGMSSYDIPVFAPQPPAGSAAIASTELVRPSISPPPPPPTHQHSQRFFEQQQQQQHVLGGGGVGGQQWSTLPTAAPLTPAPSASGGPRSPPSPTGSVEPTSSSSSSSSSTTKIKAGREGTDNPYPSFATLTKRTPDSSASAGGKRKEAHRAKVDVVEKEEEGEEESYPFTISGFSCNFKKIMKLAQHLATRSNTYPSPYNGAVTVVEYTDFAYNHADWTGRDAADQQGGGPGALLYSTKPEAMISFQGNFVEGWYSGYAGVQGGMYYCSSSSGETKWYSNKQQVELYNATLCHFKFNSATTQRITVTNGPADVGGSMWVANFSFSTQQAYTVYSGDQAVPSLPETILAPSATGGSSSSSSKSKSSSSKSANSNTKTSADTFETKSLKVPAAAPTTLVTTVGTSVMTVTQSVSGSAPAPAGAGAGSSNSPAGSASASSPQSSTSDTSISESAGGLSQTTILLLVAGFAVVLLAIIIGVVFCAKKTNTNSPKASTVTVDSLSRGRKSHRRLLENERRGRKPVPVTSDSETEESTSGESE
ncbi:hypothetical protein T439DRAFT_380356 [Meredithblackwellia eburnea MCA 4105]